MDTPENVHPAAYNKGNDYLQSPRRSSQNTMEGSFIGNGNITIHTILPDCLITRFSSAGACGHTFLAIPTRSTYMITSFLIGLLLLLQEHRNFLHLHGRAWYWYEPQL